MIPPSRIQATPLLLLVGLVLFAPHAGEAQGIPRLSLTLLGGLHTPTGSGESWDALRDRLALEASDLRGAAVEAELGLRISSQLEVIGGVETTAGEAETFLRGTEMRPGTLRLGTGPGLYGGARIHLLRLPLGGARGLALFGMGGAGKWLEVELSQTGPPLEGSSGEPLEADGGAYYGFVGSGLTLDLSRRLGVTVRGRYQFSQVELSEGLDGFETLDLAGIRLSAGFTFRF
jgi:hypothetical protein